MYSQLNNNETLDDETSTERREMETTVIVTSPTPNSYGSTRVEDKSSDRSSRVPVCGLIFYIMGFFGFVCSGSLRETLSVAIIDMVNQTTVTEADIAMTNDTDRDVCPRDPELENEGGEFNWDRQQQTIVLSAFYYGYGITQIPGGIASDRYGGKWLFGGCILLSSVVALLTPSAARINIAFLIVLRFLSGLGEGVMLPAIHSLIARWSVPQHRSVVVSFIFIGTDVGIIFGLTLSGFLCDSGFAGGWPSAFIVFGIVGCIWSFAWLFLCYDSPTKHPRISNTEFEYWKQSIGSENLAMYPPTPWRKILTSVPLWALAVAYFSNDWGYFTFVSCLPMYMQDVLGFNMTKNGFFSAIPFLASIIMIPPYGIFADWLRAPGRLSTTVVRKLFCFIGLFSAGCLLIIVGYIGCDRGLAVLMLFAAVACGDITVSCVCVNQLDLAPLHAGIIMGLTYTFSNLGAITGPLAVGALTYERSTRDEWQKVFFLAAGINAIGATVFVIFGSGERQSWAG